MKKTIFAGLVAGLVAGTFGVMTMPAMADDDDYGVINETGMVITHLYLSPTNEDEWGDDILEEDVLEDGDECGIEFHPDDEECAYDVRIVDDNEKAWVVKGVDLCAYTKVTFYTQGPKMMWRAE